MFRLFIYYAFLFFRNLFVIAALLSFLLCFWIFKGGDLAKRSTIMDESNQMLQDLLKIDPEAATVFQQISDQKTQTALLLGAYSTKADQRYRSKLSEMATETSNTRALPYRSRLAKLALEKMDLRDEEIRNAFLMSYSMVCESLAESSDWIGIDRFLSLLEQAANDPTVWPLVKDDPLALIIWSQINDPSLLEFYHRNRDWLADPLASPELNELVENWDLETALYKFSQYETPLKEAVINGELGIFALSMIASHGALVGETYDRYNLDPAEVMSVIYMNPDIFGETEKNARWVGEMAAWLVTIARQHPVIWFSAGMTPFALQLYKDVPSYAGDVLEKYGADDVTVLIYSLFSNSTEQLIAATTAVAKFGDVAIYVFSRYGDHEFSDQLGRFLADKDIGIRAIPFVVQFGDESFSRLNDDKKWAQRYFNADGSPRDDNLAWVSNLPGGAPVVVVRNWVKGYPSEWSELGWAALDVATLPLIVGKTATSGAKIASSAAKQGRVLKTVKNTSRSTASITRNQKTLKWSKSLETYRKGAASGASQMTRLKTLAKNVASSGIIFSKTAAGGLLKGPKAVANVVYKTGKTSLNQWRGLTPKSRLWIKRGILGMVMFINVTERVIPNMDKIGSGLGGLIGDAASGAITLAGEALSSALSRFFDHLTNENQIFRQIAYWSVMAALALGTLLFMCLGIKQHTGYKIVRAKR